MHAYDSFYIVYTLGVCYVCCYSCCQWTKKNISVITLTSDYHVIDDCTSAYHVVHVLEGICLAWSTLPAIHHRSIIEHKTWCNTWCTIDWWGTLHMLSIYNASYKHIRYCNTIWHCIEKVTINYRLLLYVTRVINQWFIHCIRLIMCNVVVIHSLCTSDSWYIHNCNPSMYILPIAAVWYICHRSMYMFMTDIAF
jgi:hypothetical protein